MAIAAVEEELPVRRSTPKSVQVAAAVVGNALEWYDFTIFGFLTVVISELFFPTDSQYASLLLTTATFGAGFLMRPLGGILLGVYADRKGRKDALQFIIGLMTVAIAIITFAPTYAAIGVVAPLSILIARLLQGLATGGEWGCSTAFLIESAPTGQRGFYGSWQMASQGLALLAGALVSFFVTRIFTPDAFLSWGWRIPFLIGLFIGPVGIFIRRYLNETDAFLELPLNKQENQFAKMVATHFKELLVCIGLYSGGTISFYVILLYMPTFATTQLHLSFSKALVAQSVGLACMVSLVPLFGALSDRVGRKPILIGAFLPYLGLAYPLFAWVHAHPTFANLLIMQVVLCSFLGAFYGPMATVLAEQFPAQIRSTAIGIISNVAAVVFGGFAPFYVTWLIATTGSPVAPVFYVSVGVAVSIVSAYFIVDRGRESRLRTEIAMQDTSGNRRIT
jgi:MHS family proline/betaine transporter-like MFS transporter